MFSKLTRLMFVALLICIMTLVVLAAPLDPVTNAKNFVTLLEQHKFNEAFNQCDSTMQANLPSDKLKEIWQTLNIQAGPFKKQVGTRTQKYKSMDIVFVTCEFDQAYLDTKVVLNAAGKVAGLFFVPGEAPAVASEAPDYVQPSRFEEKEVTIGRGEWALPATLTLPVGVKNAPVLILVHGSGPQDRDETVGPNKPFKDIAWGLASRGIAVLRYEKRTKQHSEKLASVVKTITVKEETVDDAAAAVVAMQARNDLDGKRVYVLGHSLGGMLIPQIAQATNGVAGFIILAGTTRPLEDVILDQVRYLAPLQSKSSTEAETAIAEIQKQVALVKSSALTDTVSSTRLPLGVPAHYWLDLRSYDPAAAAKAIKQPLLILQGDRDYQVTMQDFDGWKKALSGQPQVTLKVLPKLNHLFIEGTGKSTPAEYDQAGHVSEIVITTIGEWMDKAGGGK